MEVLFLYLADIVKGIVATNLTIDIPFIGVDLILVVANQLTVIVPCLAAVKLTVDVPFISVDLIFEVEY